MSMRWRSSRFGVLILAVVAVAGLLLSGGAAAAATPAPPAPMSCSGCWHPALNTSWDWVISKVPTAPYRAVTMYDIDGFEATAANVSSLHGAGKKVVCYISAGTYENWRPDANSIPAALRGKNVSGWAGEKWLDIRDIQKSPSPLRNVMDARLDMCKSKGFDMVELDNVDGFDNPSGFSLSAADQLFYNASLANDAHSRGMSVLQKNDNSQIPTLLRYFDGALNEECNAYSECTVAQNQANGNGTFGLDQYVAAGKPVFQAEYTTATSKFCSKDNANNFNGVKFNSNYDLNDSVFSPCR